MPDELSRRRFLALSGAALIAPSSVRRQADPMSYVEVRKMAKDVLDASRVKSGSSGPPGWRIKNTVGFALVTPGKGGYPAFWVRDFSMAADSGLVPEQEIRDHLLLIARGQNGPEERHLGNGLIVPPHAVPDHINFDGKPVFYPGTYSSGSDQGDGTFGRLPPMDDAYEFVHLAYLLHSRPGGKELLKERIAGLTLQERLIHAFDSVETEFRTDLCTTSKDRRAVGFGFCDTVVLTGRLLMPSLLRYRAADELYAMTGEHRFQLIPSMLQLTIPRVFRDPESDWLLAATECGRQPDVWGTMLASLLLPDSEWTRKALQTIRQAYADGKIAAEAAVRHVPVDRDFSSNSMWEKCLAAYGSYQNGAYWHTATGLLLGCLRRTDMHLYRKAARKYLDHLSTFDYRRGKPGCEAPWECIGKNGEHRQNGAYLASIARPLPYLAPRR